MNRRRLILAGGTVAFTTVRMVKRNRRRLRGVSIGRHVRAVVAIPVVGAAVMPALFDFDAPAFIGKIWNFGFDVAREIKDFIFEVVMDALNFALQRLQDVRDFLVDRIDAVVDGIEWVRSKSQDALNAVGDVIVETTNRLEGAFSNFRQQLASFLEHAWDDLKNWVIENFPDWIGGFFGDIWDILTALGGIGMGGVRFLINLIDDPIGFLWALLKDTVDDAIAVALAAAGFTLDGIVGLVEMAIGILMGGIDDFFAVMKKIWHILRWIAEHIDDFTVDALELALNPSWQTIQQDIVETVDSEIDSFEKLVKKIFGLNEPITGLLDPIGPLGP